jgi:hypothetical protein
MKGRVKELGCNPEIQPLMLLNCQLCNNNGPGILVYRQILIQKI